MEVAERANTAIRIKAVILILLALAQIPVTFRTAAPGHLIPDEAINHWMAKSFAERGALDLWNGYEEIPSAELTHPFFKPRDGRLYPPYPYLFGVMAFPFYELFGYMGLFLLNSLCFMAMVGLVFLAARRMFGNVDLALNACLILVLAGFAWEYSQAAWPHATAMFFVVWTFYFVVQSYLAPDRRSALLWALATGLVAGFAPTLRIDCFLVFPALVLPFLFARPWRPLEILLMAVGTAPGLLSLSLTNHVKFGSWSPFAYGYEVYEPFPAKELVLIGAALVLIAWVLSRKRFEEFAAKRLLAVIVATVLALAATVFVAPQLWTKVETLVWDSVTMLADMRTLDPEVFAAIRTPGGGLIYLGAHKKALLQSMPFLAILLIPLLEIFRRDKDWPILTVLFLFPAGFVAYYCATFSQLGAGGGMCLNHRYLLSCLPFVAILTAWGVDRFKRQWALGLDYRVFAVSCALTLLAYYLLAVRPNPGLEALEGPLLRLPLWLAGLLLVALVGCEIPPLGRRRAFQSGAWALLVAAMTWSAAVGFFYDYPHHRHGRFMHHVYGETVTRLMPEDAILFADAKTYAASADVMERKGVRLGFPLMDRFQGFTAMLDFQLDRGRRAFAFFHEGLWADLRAGILSSYEVRPVVMFPGFWLGEISRPGGAAK